MTDTQNGSLSGQGNEGRSWERRNKIALIAAVSAATLFLLFSTTRESVILEDAETAEPAAELVPAEITRVDWRWSEMQRLPAIILNAEGEVIGSLFIDIELAVGSAEDEAYLNERLEEVRLAIMGVLDSEGVGRQDAPLEIDGERVMAMVMSWTAKAGNRILPSNLKKWRSKVR